MEPRVSPDPSVLRSTTWTACEALIGAGVEKPNFMTLGVMGNPCSDPPIAAISLKPYRYTYKLIRETGQFVINFPTAQMVREMEFAGMYSGQHIDKWKVCGFTPIKGKVVDVPLIAECPVNIECVLLHEIRFQRDDGREGSHVLVVGKMVQLHCHEKYLIDGDLQWDLIDLIFRARPRTWRALGPVLGYDIRKKPPTNPHLAAELINQRTAALADLMLPLDRTPPPLSFPSDTEPPPRVD